MTEFKEKHSLSEENVGPIVFKYCWKPSGITKNEFETVSFIKQELEQCEDSDFCLKNDDQTWNDNVTIDEVDVKTELSVTFNSEQSDSSDSDFNLLVERLQGLADDRYNISSGDDCNDDSLVTPNTTNNAEETAVDKLENALKFNKSKKENKLIKKDRRSVRSNKYVQSNKESIRQVFMCDHCHFITLSKNTLRRHIFSSHFPSSGLFKCHHCNFSANKKYSMSRHMMTHLKMFPFSCDSCTYKCNTNYQLKNHNKINHQKKQPTVKSRVCEICGKILAGCNIAAHLLTHKTGPHFFCKLCTYSGRCIKRYKMHVLTHSEDYKAPVRHACAMCDYTSDQLRHVRRHAIVHVNGRKTNGRKTNGRKVIERKANGVRKRRRKNKKKQWI